MSYDLAIDRQSAYAKHRRGFSLLELVAVISIISILVAVALDRLLPYIDEAERVAVLRVEGQLRSTLVMEAAKRIVRGQSASISELEGANPVNFLAEPPNNYAGENRLAEAPPRHWYFDSAGRRLVYRRGPGFAREEREAAQEDPAFAVRVAYADVDGDGVFEADRDDFYAVRLERVAGAKWLDGAAD